MNPCDHYYGKVFAHLTGALGIASLSAEYSNIGSQIIPGSKGLSILFNLVLGIALIIGINLTESGGILKYVFFIAFAILMGQIMKPIITKAQHNHQIVHLLLLTTGVFAGMMAIGFYDNQNLIGFGSYLFVSLIGLLIAQGLWIVLATVEQRIQTQSILSMSGVAIFAVYTAYHTQVIKERAKSCRSNLNRGKYPDYPLDSLSFLLDYINLFSSIVRSR
jgi:FtsH-binding integral membrane protein